MQATIKNLVGFYQFISPYHEDKRLLPFKVVGASYDKTHPLLVETVEYKGFKKIDCRDNYSIEVVQNYINTGLLKKVAPTDLNPLFIDQIGAFSHLVTLEPQSKKGFLKTLKKTYCLSNPKTELFYLATKRSSFNTIRLNTTRNQILFNY